MRFHRQDDDILRAGGGVVVGRPDCGNGLFAAVAETSPNAAVTKCLEIRSARE